VDRADINDDFKYNALVNDIEFINEVASLTKKGLELSRTISDLKLSRDYQTTFLVHMNLLTKIQKLVDNSGAFGNRPRTRPLVIWISGESQIGKSGMAWPLAIDLNNQLMTTEADAIEFSKNIYFRNTEQVFWDNYFGQNIVCYDDFGQRIDAELKPNEEYMELIRAANIAPYPLHMAGLEEKKKCKFVSKALILTSNILDQRINSLNYPDAVAARVDICAVIKNKAEFQKECFSVQKQTQVKRLDVDKVLEITGESLSTSIYEIDLVNPETREVVRANLSYEEFLSHCIEKFKKETERSKNFNNYLTNYAKQRYQTLRGNNQGHVVDLQDPSSYITKTDLECTTENIQVWSDYVWNKIKRGGIYIKTRGKEILITNKDFFTIDKDTCVDYVLQTYKTFTIRFNAKFEEFKIYANSILDKIIEAAKVAINAITSHPFIAISGILLTLSTAFGLWMLSKKSQKPKTNVLDKISSHIVRVSNFPPRKGIPFVALHSEVTQEEIMNALAKHDGDIVAVQLPVEDDISNFVENLTALIDEDSLSIFVIIVSSTKFSLGFRQQMRLWREIRQHFAATLIKICEYDEEKRKWYSGEIESQCPNAPTILEMEVEASYNSRGTHSHKCVKCGVDYIHDHPYRHVNHPQFPNQCPNEDCEWYFANGSGNTTNARFFEATSGDGMTHNPRRKIVKEVTSGDNNTHNVRRKIIKEATSGDPLTVNPKRKVVLENEEGELQYWVDVGANTLIANRILKNQYRMVGEDCVGNVTGAINVLFVCGTIAITAKHVSMMLDMSQKVHLENCFGVKWEVTVADIKSKPLLDVRGEEKEVCVLTFPVHVMTHCDIRKHFQDAESLRLVSRPKCLLPAIRPLHGMQVPIIYTVPSARTHDVPIIFNDDASGTSTVIRKSIHYEAPTKAGDCGSPLIIQENKVLRKILGIHVAATTEGMSISESITQKDLQRALTTIAGNYQIRFDDDSFTHSNLLPVVLPKDVIISNIRDIFSPYIPVAGFNPLSICTEVPALPTKTALRRSLIYGQITEVKTKPSRLTDLFVNGERVSILNKNLQKAALDTPEIPKELVDQAILSYRPLMLKNKKDYLARIFTIEEAVEGIVGEEFVAPIARRSSPGYPWVLERPSGTVGKQHWLGSDEEYRISDDLRAAVMERISKAKKGIRVPTIWTDTLKDERRPIEKVDAGKTRVFAAGPMDYTLAFRMYFLGFIANIMENRIDNEQSLGTNPYGNDWKRTAQRLTKFGDNNVIAGDFTTFDGTLNACILSRMCDEINKWYDDGPMNAMIRQVMFKEIYNSIHLNPALGVYYSWTHSQPSGCPLTTVLNSWYNSISMRVVYGICSDRFCDIGDLGKYPISSFNKYVSMVSYGDDNCVAISPEIVSWFNQNTISEGYKVIGMIYTDETKHEGISPPTRNISEIQYLKRNFIYDKKTSIWKAPLSLETVLEMPNWCRDSVDMLEGSMLNLLVAVEELSLHSQEVFDKWSKVMMDAFYAKTGEYPEISTYSGYNQQRYVKYFM